MKNFLPDWFFEYKANYFRNLEEYKNSECKYGRKGALIVFCKNMLLSYQVKITLIDDIKFKLWYDISNITCEDLNSDPIGIEIHGDLFLKQYLRLETSKDIVIEYPLFFKKKDLDLLLIGFNNNRETQSGRVVSLYDF